MIMNQGLILPGRFGTRARQRGFIGGRMLSAAAGVDGEGGGGALWTHDGDTLSGWTVSGATVNNTEGNPAPSIQALGGEYAYIAPVGDLVGKTLEVDVFVISGTQLCNLPFACDAAGSGQMIRLDARNGQNSGITTMSSWTSWGTPPGTDEVVPADQWIRVRVDIKAGPVADWYWDSMLIQSDVGISNNGGYIAAHGDGGPVEGGRYDNWEIRST